MKEGKKEGTCRKEAGNVKKGRKECEGMNKGRKEGKKGG
jgi:hypothetical protein